MHPTANPWLKTPLSHTPAHQLWRKQREIVLILVGETSKAEQLFYIPLNSSNPLLRSLPVLGFINIYSTKGQNPLVKSLSLLHRHLRLPYQVLVTQAELMQCSQKIKATHWCKHRTFSILEQYFRAGKGILYSILLSQVVITSPLQGTLLVDKSPLEQTSVLLHLSYKLRLLWFPLLLCPNYIRPVKKTGMEMWSAYKKSCSLV